MSLTLKALRHPGSPGFIAVLYCLSSFLCESQAAISLVQTVTGGNTTSSVTATFVSTPVSGDLLIAIMGTRGSGTITGPSGWSTATNESGSSVTAPNQAVFYKVAGASESKSVTVTTAASGNGNGLQIYEFAGTASSSPLDAVNSVSSTGTGTVVSSGTVNATYTNDLVIAGLVTTQGNNFSSWTNSFTGLNNFTEGGGGGQTLFGGADQVISTNGSFTTSATSNVSGNWRGQIAAFKDANPLPIELATFTATMLRSSSVRLEWTTLSEVDNYGFEVQKSMNRLDSYMTISDLIPGHGTTVLPHTYVFTDNSHSTGRYYRLRQIDLDRTVHLSEPIEAGTASESDGQPATYELSGNYPNPFNPATIITYRLPAGSPVRLVVYDFLGREIAVLVNEKQDAGVYSVKFEAGGLPSGVYFYRLQAGDFVATKRLVLIR